MMSFQPRSAPRSRAPNPASTPAEPDESAAAPERRTGITPGWHTSSLDLMEGLEISEASLDSLPPEFADRLRPR